MEKWDDENTIVCVKPYLNYKLNRSYDITGRGSLDYNCDPNVNGRKGFGVCINFPKTDNYLDKNWLKLPYDKKYQLQYLDLNELNEFFIPYYEYYNIQMKKQRRNDRLNQLGI